MNLGTWILAKFGACAGMAALPALLKMPRPVRRAGDAAWKAAGLLGLPMTGYTGVLLANTAVPLWQGAGRTLPALFSASSAAAAASLLELLPSRGDARRATRRFAVWSKAGELAMTLAVEREAAAVPRVARPLRSGLSGTLWRTAQALSAASLALSLLFGRRGGRIAGVLGTAGAIALRFALIQGGRRSARDPGASFEQQRARDAANRQAQQGAPGERPPLHPALEDRRDVRI
jgi:hypothetical protein